MGLNAACQRAELWRTNTPLLQGADHKHSPWPTLPGHSSSLSCWAWTPQNPSCFSLFPPQTCRKHLWHSKWGTTALADYIPLRKRGWAL